MAEGVIFMVMDGWSAGFARTLYAEHVSQHLQRQQHLDPQRSLETAMARAERELGFCPEAGQRALTTLGLDRSRKIGRLKRCELVQLARTILRNWHQTLAAQSQPA
jgi:hypothetical protein